MAYINEVKLLFELFTCFRSLPVMMSNHIIKKRIDLKELDVPIVIKIDSVRYVTNKPTQSIKSGIENEILLPPSTCTVSSSLSCEQFVGIIVNKKYYFSKDDLTICKNIHKLKGTQENLKIEDQWFERVATDVRTPSFVIPFLKDSRT